MRKTIALTAVVLLLGSAFCVSVFGSTGTKSADMVPPITGVAAIRA